MAMRVDRKFSLSCETFGGYTCSVPVNDAETVGELVESVLARLESTLRQNNFEALISILSSKRAGYHIHDVSLADVLLGDRDVFYVCDSAGCPERPAMS